MLPRSTATMGKTKKTYGCWLCGPCIAQRCGRRCFRVCRAWRSTQPWEVTQFWNQANASAWGPRSPPRATMAMGGPQRRNWNQIQVTKSGPHMLTRSTTTMGQQVLMGPMPMERSFSCQNSSEAPSSDAQGNHFGPTIVSKSHNGHQGPQGATRTRSK